MFICTVYRAIAYDVTNYVIHLCARNWGMKLQAPIENNVFFVSLENSLVARSYCLFSEKIAIGSLELGKRSEPLF